MALSGLEAYDAVRGIASVTVTATDDQGIVTLELLVNGDLAVTNNNIDGSRDATSMDWDTSQSSDGPVDLTARATDAAGNTTTSAPVRIVIVNSGVEFLELEEGLEATMQIPPDYDGSQETHIKHHFTPTADYARALCVALWENPVGGAPWNLKAEMGAGTCPHRGRTFEGHGLSDTGAVELDVTPTGGIARDTRHFCHVGAENAAEHAGESLALAFKIFLFD